MDCGKWQNFVFLGQNNTFLSIMGWNYSFWNIGELQKRILIPVEGLTVTVGWMIQGWLLIQEGGAWKVVYVPHHYPAMDDRNDRLFRKDHTGGEITFCFRCDRHTNVVVSLFFFNPKMRSKMDNYWSPEYFLNKEALHITYTRTTIEIQKLHKII